MVVTCTLYLACAMPRVLYSESSLLDLAFLVKQDTVPTVCTMHTDEGRPWYWLYVPPAPTSDGGRA